MTSKTSTREEIIRKGAELIHAQGYKGTGIQQILQSSGIPKGSFYFYFKSKEDFGLAVIDHFTAAIGEIFTACLSDRDVPPMGRFEKLFDYYESAFQKTGGALGCPIGNLSLELADTNERIREHLRTAIEGLVAQIESCLAEAIRDKSLPEDVQVADTARFIFYGFEGAILHMKVVKSTESLQAFRRSCRDYLNAQSNS
jgi:TetR/AcrR family transcriptional regulator, transcriptional repressor for nem operon